MESDTFARSTIFSRPLDGESRFTRREEPLHSTERRFTRRRDAFHSTERAAPLDGERPSRLERRLPLDGESRSTRRREAFPIGETPSTRRREAFPIGETPSTRRRDAFHPMGRAAPLDGERPSRLERRLPDRPSLDGGRLGRGLELALDGGYGGEDAFEVIVLSPLVLLRFALNGAEEGDDARRHLLDAAGIDLPLSR